MTCEPHCFWPVSTTLLTAVHFPGGDACTNRSPSHDSRPEKSLPLTGYGRLGEIANGSFEAFQFAEPGFG